VPCEAAQPISDGSNAELTLNSNIEVGVLLDDPSFACFLAAQWVGLIEAGIVQEYKAGV
jgi:hypothetical protein